MWRELWTTYGGRVTGVVTALFLGFIYLFSGFWDMLFFALLLWIGYFFGKQRDISAPPFIPWQQILAWLQSRWRIFK
ncbi:DUF2273 domain-containing protein [Paenibacillus sp. GCM10012307]|uniref:DUF2273 domain-containing protein n=1 Tax=Paenibacillus roseus TaxID=2798579 RepID=A0A934JBT0_9BACL|nr:DUF2273 domain-containing protein [Paenibacillus roseus]MBJ6364236.1 DUF2273 domain-containing protein [Paenibacillus roseus]